MGPIPRCGGLLDDANGNKTAELGHKEFFTSDHTATDAKIFSSGVLVEMRPRDAMASTTYVNIGDVTIAEISLHMNNTPKRFVRFQDVSVLRVSVRRGGPKLGMSNSQCR